MSSIELRKITKAYGDTAVLHDVSMVINEGEMVSLVGPSGSGKTTILRLIAGLTEMNDGQILIDDKDAGNLSNNDRGAVIVYQDYALFPHMTVFDNIAFGLKVRKVNRITQKTKVMELIQLLHMEGYENRYPSELSGGQKQRVAIARALAIEPKVLLLDEPFSSLDRHLRHSMRSLIKELQRRIGITTILVTHDIEEALMVSDKIAVLLDGQVAQMDTPQNVYEKPVRKDVADFLGNKNIHQGFLCNGELQTPFGNISVSSQYDGNVYILYQQDAIRMSTYETDGIKGLIADFTYTGRALVYKVETDQGIFDIIKDISCALSVGDTVYLSLNSNGLSIFRDDTGGLL